jgi:hypothetical protein
MRQRVRSGSGSTHSRRPYNDLGAPESQPSIVEGEVIGVNTAIFSPSGHGNEKRTKSTKRLQNASNRDDFNPAK